MLETCRVVGIALKPPNPKERKVLPLPHAVRCAWPHISHFGVENVEDARIPEWVIVIGLVREDCDVRVRSGVDGILLAPHVICGVVHLKHFVTIEMVFIDLKTVLLLLREWFIVLIRVT